LLQFTPHTATLPEGSYTAAVTVSKAGVIDSPQIVTVTVFVGDAQPAIDLDLRPGTTGDFHFPGGNMSCPRGCSAPVATTQNAGQWLTASVVTDSQTTISVSWHWQIRLAPAGEMPPGIYIGTVSAGSANIPVTLRLPSPSGIAASPDQIDIRVAQGGPPITSPFLSPITLNQSGSTIPAQSVTTSGKGITASLSAGSVIVNVDPAGLTPGLYTDGRLTIACALADCPINVPVHLEIVPQGPPQIDGQGVVNNATFSPLEPAAPGDVMILKGEQLSLNPASFASRTPLPMALGGVTVTVDGVGAPLYYTSAGQASFQMPYSTTPGAAQVQLFREGRPSNTVSVTVVPRAPQIVAITDAAYALRDATHPAHPDEPLIIWAIGLGQTTPAVITGATAPSNPLAAITPLPLINLGDSSLPASFAGLAPGQVGLYQVNFIVPAGTPKGLVSVTLGFRFGYFSDVVPLAIQ
jgi:uncharacterized protein (TIGR03437 family)